ncbi:hypothetical protein LTR82_002318 [Friedmanniomyces endolithicus]|uniref:DAGKc domain-containing protein n=1 Tax=Friedmanniomyces endolithicus TaxID=329885 RepID=A0AAN6G0H5_9PEZI|nr:hypothetical protein LTR82_002318 [Friedmanniomyces endolithicus]
MGNEESSPSRTEGQIDGRPVTFTLRQDEKTRERELIWQERENKFEGRLADKDIIAVLPVHAQIPDDYSILYAAPNPSATNEPTASPVLFKSLLATRLPQAFIHHFQPPGNACWQLRADNGSLPNLHIIVSSRSGTGQAEDVWTKLLKPMLQHVCPKADAYAMHHTTSEHSVAELTQEVFLTQANDGIMQAIILLSGDGGLVDIVNALLEGPRGKRYKKPNATLLPLGTGNAMAHSVGLTNDNTLGLRNLLQGTTRPLPLFRASFSPGARLLVNEAREERSLSNVNGVPTVFGSVVCSWGLHAGLVADSDTSEYRKHGAERFKMAAEEALFPKDGSPAHAYRGKISVMRPRSKDWERVDRETHAYVLATLVSKLEKGFTISPASKPLDGKLRLVHFGDIGGKGAMEIMTKACDGGKHIGDERVGYEEILGLRIESEEEDDRWRRVWVDGKIVRVEAGGWVEVRGGVESVLDLIVDERR